MNTLCHASSNNVASFLAAPLDSWTSEINYAICARPTAALFRTCSMWRGLLWKATQMLHRQHLWQQLATRRICIYLMDPMIKGRIGNTKPFMACLLPLSHASRSWNRLTKKILKELSDVSYI